MVSVCVPTISEAQAIFLFNLFYFSPSLAGQYLYSLSLGTRAIIFYMILEYLSNEEL